MFLRLKSSFIVHLAKILKLLILRPYYLCYVKHKKKINYQKKTDKFFILLKLCETPKRIQLAKKYAIKFVSFIYQFF